MNPVPLSTANLDVLAIYMSLPGLDEQQVNNICKMLSSIESGTDNKSDILRMVRTYLEGVVPNMAILNQFAICGFFNIQDDRSRTPLHWIISEPRLRSVFEADLIRTIVIHGGNAAITDINGDSPLHLALIENVDSNVVAALLEGQLKPSPLLTTRNKIGWTPMRILAEHHDLIKIETLTVLKDFGGDINETDNSGNSLLHIMFSTTITYRGMKDMKFGDIAKTFVELGADVNFKNNSNLVPLRLAIDLKIVLNYLIPLIPSVEVLNDDSCWDGTFIDYVLENFKGKAVRENITFVNAVFEHIDAIRVTEKTMFLAVTCNIEPEHVELLLAKGCRVNMDVLNKALDCSNYKLIEPLLIGSEDELEEMVKVHHPNIFVRMSSACWQDNDLSWMYNLISLLLSKFNIDVNYKETGEKEWTLLHNLIRFSSDEADLSTLELVLAVEGLDLENTIKVEVRGKEVSSREMAALEYAICVNRYDAAELLIKNFADTSKLPRFQVDCYNGFALCFILLSVLGYKVDFEESKKSANKFVKQEIEYVENWVKERSKKVLTLKELSALKFRRHATKEEVNQLIKDIEIPQDIQDILYLECFESDFMAMEVDHSETSDESDFDPNGFY